MTTILWDGKQLVSDSQVSEEGVSAIDPTPKIFRKKHVYYAAAGDLTESMAVVRWHVRGAKPKDFPDDLSGEYHVLVVKNGKAIEYAGSRHTCPVKPPVAMGSGRELALGALLAGASAKRAVAIACRLDNQSSPPLRVYNTCQSKRSKAH